MTISSSEKPKIAVVAVCSHFMHLWLQTDVFVTCSVDGRKILLF